MKGNPSTTLRAIPIQLKRHTPDRYAKGEARNVENKEKIYSKERKGQMKLYRVIVNTGTDVFEEWIAALSKKGMLDVYGGNGKFEVIEDVTRKTLEEFVKKSAKGCMKTRLTEAGFSREEATLMLGLMTAFMRKKGIEDA